MARDVWFPGENIKMTLQFDNKTSKEVKRIETMILPNFFQKCNKREVTSRMPAMFLVKRPDTCIKPNESRKFHFDIELGNELFPTFDTGKLIRYFHVAMVRVFVSFFYLF